MSFLAKTTCLLVKETKSKDNWNKQLLK